MSTQTQLSQMITDSILNDIRNGIYKGQKFLPPEVDLAKTYNVSRNMVRESLTRLEREGWISRKHGVGTIINWDIISAQTRLDLNYELYRTLELSGKVPRTKSVTFRTEPASGDIAFYLGITHGDPVLRSARLILADGEPAMYCIDYLPEKFLNTHDYSAADLKENFFKFVDRFCGIQIETNLAEIRAVPVPKEVSDAMEIPEDSTLLYIGEIGYDMRSNPILYSEEYFIDGMIRHMIVRKKI